MAFSLEAALVVPITLSLLTGSLVIAEQTARRTNRLADLAVRATLRQFADTRFYQVERLDNEDGTICIVMTSPQKSIEAGSLIHDLLQPVSAWLNTGPGPSGAEQTGVVQP